MLYLDLFYLKADARKSKGFYPSRFYQKIWFPLIKDWLAQIFTPHETVYLAIDRTNWGRNNLIMISVIYDERAIPLYFELLPKLGNSDFAEQSRVFSQVRPLFENYKIIVLGDRELGSIKLANWLREKRIHFCLSIEKK